MDNLDKASTLSDFLADISDKHHDFEPPEMDYKLVYWNGKEREPLVIEGIDHEAKCITLTDVRRWEGVELTTDQIAELDRKARAAKVSARSQYAELQRRYQVDEDSHIETLHDSIEYMNDVLARGPLDATGGATDV